MKYCKALSQGGAWNLLVCYNNKPAPSIAVRKCQVCYVSSRKASCGFAHLVLLNNPLKSVLLLPPSYSQRTRLRDDNMFQGTTGRRRTSEPRLANIWLCSLVLCQVPKTVKDIVQDTQAARCPGLVQIKRLASPRDMLDVFSFHPRSARALPATLQALRFLPRGETASLLLFPCLPLPWQLSSIWAARVIFLG